MRASFSHAEMEVLQFLVSKVPFMYRREAVRMLHVRRLRAFETERFIASLNLMPERDANGTETQG